MCVGSSATSEFNDTTFLLFRDTVHREKRLQYCCSRFPGKILKDVSFVSQLTGWLKSYPHILPGPGINS